MPSLNQRPNLPLRRNRPLQIQPPKLILPRPINLHRITKPLVALPTEHKLRRTQGVRNVLKGIDEAVRKVVGRVDLPFGARTVVRSVEDAIGYEVPHLGVA